MSDPTGKRPFKHCICLPEGIIAVYQMLGYKPTKTRYLHRNVNFHVLSS